LFQDRTEARLGADAIADTIERLATQRLQSAFERAQVDQLRRAFFPPPWTRRQCGELAIVARHVAPTGIQSFRGDFYEIDQTDTGLLIVVGDVFGSGVAAAHSMVRLRQGAKAFALASAPVADVLGLLNRELCRDQEPPLASMVLAAIDLEAHTFTWAQAGHYSPILVRHGRARSLRRPRGDVLGLLASTRFGRATVQLQPGDLLALFTDGVFQRQERGATPIRRVVAQCEQAQRQGGAEALLERLAPPENDEACLVAVEWVGR
jgi:serine phosphatase RsbU (regulator of sigma subunit)